MKDDDLDIFRAEMGDVTPLKQDAVVNPTAAHEPSLAQTLKRAALLQEQAAETYHLGVTCTHWVDPHDPIAFRQNGIQDGVYKNLRMGKYAVESRINLTQMRVEDARNALVEQIENHFQRGTRVILIKHGMGLQSKPQPGKMKSMVNMWLPQLPQVIAYHSAQPSHGGLSACYVLLKKNPEQKLVNRERHQKRY